MARTTIPAELVAINAIQGTLIADNAITAVHIATNAVSGTLVADKCYNIYSYSTKQCDSYSDSNEYNYSNTDG